MSAVHLQPTKISEDGGRNGEQDYYSHSRVVPRHLSTESWQASGNSQNKCHDRNDGSRYTDYEEFLATFADRNPAAITGSIFGFYYLCKFLDR
jgi:hypothetical protein